MLGIGHCVHSAHCHHSTHPCAGTFITAAFVDSILCSHERQRPNKCQASTANSTWKWSQSPADEVDVADVSTCAFDFPVKRWVKIGVIFEELHNVQIHVMDHTSRVVYGQQTPCFQADAWTYIERCELSHLCLRHRKQ